MKPPRIYDEDLEYFKGSDNRPPGIPPDGWIIAILVALLIALFLFGCSVTKPIPQPTQPVYKYYRLVTVNKDNSKNYSTIKIIK